MWRNETDKRIYRTADGKVVDEGHPDAAYLVVGPGGELSDDEAKEYGLVKAQAEPADAKARAKPDDK